MFQIRNTTKNYNHNQICFYYSIVVFIHNIVFIHYHIIFKNKMCIIILYCICVHLGIINNNRVSSCPVRVLIVPNTPIRINRWVSPKPQNDRAVSVDLFLFYFLYCTILLFIFYGICFFIIHLFPARIQELRSLQLQLFCRLQNAVYSFFYWNESISPPVARY